MKKLILFSTALCIVTFLNAQTSAIDEFFEKYSEKEGFTTVTISSKLLSLFAGKKSEGSDIINRLTSIKILSVEDSLLNQSINFQRELSKKTNFSGYEELMVVKEGSDATMFLTKQKGDIITELLVITGGPGGNTLISIKGDLDLKSLSELSNETGIDELRGLEKIKKEKEE
ncbi:MAG TPA: hypothetical protein DEO60_04870 [Bacteroidales bacterium]|nr:hypothetical protein [Bacteroidales bacterium]HBZ20441.1 hypothetical protein [Bacteroidales bacterium]